MRVLSHIVLFILLSLSCGSSVSGGNIRADIKPGSWIRNIRVEYDADEKKCYGTMQMYFPKGYTGGPNTRTLIVLHGYRQSPADWERLTPVAEWADTCGFVLACPAMTTTLYESKYFPETVSRWAPVPGGVFISRVLIDFLRKNYGLAGDRGRTGIFGISTGARGALLLAAQHDKIFGAAAGLSGDYDSSSMSSDRLLVAMYGPYELNRERWEEEVNILRLAGRLKKTPVFLGHGTRDAVVPPPQTTMLADRLKQLKEKNSGYELIVDTVKSDGAGHDWRYWGSLVPEVFKFFDERLEK